VGAVDEFLIPEEAERERSGYDESGKYRIRLRLWYHPEDAGGGEDECPDAVDLLPPESESSNLDAVPEASTDEEQSRDAEKQDSGASNR